MKRGEGKDYSEHVGKRFSRLEVLGYRLKKFSNQRATVFVCRCDCGRSIETIVANVLCGYTSQCVECARNSIAAKTKTHGLSGSLFRFASPAGMKAQTVEFRGHQRTVSEIAKILGISRQAVYQRIEGGRVRESRVSLRIKD